MFDWYRNSPKISPGVALVTGHSGEGALAPDWAALARSGLAERHGLAADAWKVGVWGRLAPPAQPLRDLDRVELYRPLQVDPKEARRLRYKGQRQGRKTPPAARG